MPKAHFSEADLEALRLLALDRRYMDPQKFAHVRAELGLETISNGQNHSRRGSRWVGVVSAGSLAQHCGTPPKRSTAA